MEIILKKDVQNLGNADEIVEVRNGYANNYLIPQGYAIMATPSAKKVHEENLRQRAHKEAKMREDATLLAGKISALQVQVMAKVSESGKVFGSVTNIQVAEALEAQGFEIDRRNVKFAIGDVLKETGIFDATLKIYKDIVASFKVEVVGQE